MKLAPALVAVALTAAVPATASAQGGLAPIGSAPATTTHAAVPGEVIAQFESRVSPSARGNSRRAAEVGVVKAMVHRGQQLLRVRAGQTVDDAIRALER